MKERESERELIERVRERELIERVRERESEWSSEAATVSLMFVINSVYA